MTFKERLLRCGCQTYGEYLKSNHWLNFRAKYQTSTLTSKRCYVCGTSKIQLHHTTYDRLGNESLDDVIPLCRRHHEEVHTWLKENGRGVQSSNKAASAIRTQRARNAQSVNGSVMRQKAKSKRKRKQKRIAKATAQFRKCDGCTNQAAKDKRLCRKCSGRPSKEELEIRNENIRRSQEHQSKLAALLAKAAKIR